MIRCPRSVIRVPTAVGAVDTYFHTDEVVIAATARRCYELVLAVRRYGQWWPQVRCDPLGPEAELRLGDRFRLSAGAASWTIEVVGLQPWRRIDLRYAEGELLGPASWEFISRGGSTVVRYAYRGVQANSEGMRQSFASGFGTRVQAVTLQGEALGGMRRLLESGHDITGGDLFEAMHTLGSVRTFRADPIPDASLRFILEAATHVASDQNTQPWYFVVVRNPALKRDVAALYRSAGQPVQAESADRNTAGEGRPGDARLVRNVAELADSLDQAPVLVCVCLDAQELDPSAGAAASIRVPQSAYASTFAAVQNLMLAARGLGIGSTLATLATLLSSVESEMRQALDLPPHVHLAALVPLGYPKHPFRVTQDKPITQIAFLDRWGTQFLPE